MSEIEKKLTVTRYKNGGIESIHRSIFMKDHYDSVADESIGPTAHPYGLSVDFYENGKVKKIQEWDFPKSHSLYHSHLSKIYDSVLLWEKEFDKDGKITQSFGTQGPFIPKGEQLVAPLGGRGMHRPDSEVQGILEKEKLWPAVEKAILAKRRPISRSTLIKKNIKERE